MGKPITESSLYTRIENEITSYTSRDVEIVERVFFNQHKLINRIYRFRNCDLGDPKLNPDLSYKYYFDIISPRVDGEVKNLRFDTKHILIFSLNPRKDFPVVFISNAMLKSWMADNGEDEKLKAVVEEFVANGNIGFKKVAGGYETMDPLNTYVTNITAETVDDTALVERHEKSASDLKRMTTWDQDKVDKVIETLGNKFFTTSELTTPIDSTGNKYEIFEYTGEVSEKEFNSAQGLSGGDEHTYFLAKVIVAGLRKGGKGEKYTLFAEKLKGKMSDWYKYAHRGRYQGRFWRIGMYELLFDHQIRANEIGNQLARGLDWASRTLLRSKDRNVLQNVRADMDNGDIIITDDLEILTTRMQGLDQLLADWNRLITDADRLSNSLEVVRGENLPAGTPFRMGMLLDQNAGKLYTLLRQKISLPYKKVFGDWVLGELVKELKGKDIFRFVNEPEILDQLWEIMAESWYQRNLVKIGPHTKEIADSIKAEKLEELKRIDPVLNNVKEIWKDVGERLFVTITGENSDIQDQMQDLMTLIGLEEDPVRRAWILDTIYKARGIPIPPPPVQPPVEAQLPDGQSAQAPEPVPTERSAEEPVIEQ